MKEFIEKLIEKIKSKSVPLGFGLIPDEKVIRETDAISIVNQLAEEYKNDFCEWKKVVIDSTELIREPHRMYLFKESDDKWEYCPYCGKKIKVVPYQPKGE